MSQRKDCNPVSQCPSFRNKTLSSPPSSLAASPRFHSSLPGARRSAQIMHRRVLSCNLSLPSYPQREKKTTRRKNLSALIISLKTLLAPYLWRTFNSLLPQAALPTLRNARLLRLGEERMGIEPSPANSLPGTQGSL
ncbi:Hypothetical predicted protein [Scomber scombrus]|uniref:Uncharacterized protein n=1 Tax=Scomber scombrus TaxID=13677 RepID=A0AAV1NFS3_SCOSC